MTNKEKHHLWELVKTIRHANGDIIKLESCICGWKQKKVRSVKAGTFVTRSFTSPAGKKIKYNTQKSNYPECSRDESDTNKRKGDYHPWKSSYRNALR